MRAADDRDRQGAEEAAQSICPAIRLAHRRAGPFLPQPPMRISVFIDYQNVYHSARRAFHERNSPPSFGQVSPLALAELVCNRQTPASGTSSRQLEDVRVYRGMPRLNDRAFAPAHRQIAQWRAQGVSVITRPLSGPLESPREKGIDVSLALDFYAGMMEGTFDIGVLISMDRDFEPLLEKVSAAQLRLPVPLETAVWWAPPRQQTILSANEDITCHRLRAQEYLLVRDRTNYGIQARRRRGRKRK